MGLSEVLEERLQDAARAYRAPLGSLVGANWDASRVHP